MNLIDLVIEKLENNPEAWVERSETITYGKTSSREMLEDGYYHNFAIVKHKYSHFPERPLKEIKSKTATYTLGYLESWKLGRAITRWRLVKLQSNLIEAMITGESK